MRKLVIGIGVAAMIVAVVQAARENTAQHTTQSPAVAIQSGSSAPLPNLQMQVENKSSELGASGQVFFVPSGREEGQLLAYDLASAKPRFVLPPGVLSADRAHYYSATAREGKTSLHEFELKTGTITQTRTLDGEWTLNGISPNGRWLALKRHDKVENPSKTALEIVDARNGQVAHALNLDGNFQVDAISANGDSLFLIQYLPAVNPTQYSVRLYDLAEETFRPGALRIKASEDEIMVGEAWDAIASPDGHWLLTLYLNTARDAAFIHALDLEKKLAVCIDLPSGAHDLDQLKQYTLALAPDARTVYAANAAMGVVAEVSLSDLQVTHELRLSALSTAAKSDSTERPYAYASRSVVSKDGRTVYFGSGNQVWAYKADSKQVNGPFRSNAEIVALQLSADGERLYVASEDKPLQIINTRVQLSSNITGK